MQVSVNACACAHLAAVHELEKEELVLAAGRRLVAFDDMLVVAIAHDIQLVLNNLALFLVLGRCHDLARRAHAVRPASHELD